MSISGFSSDKDEAFEEFLRSIEPEDDNARQNTIGRPDGRNPSRGSWKCVRKCRQTRHLRRAASCRISSGSSLTCGGWHFIESQGEWKRSAVLLGPFSVMSRGNAKQDFPQEERYLTCGWAIIREKNEFLSFSRLIFLCFRSMFSSNDETNHVILIIWTQYTHIFTLPRTN